MDWGEGVASDVVRAIGLDAVRGFGSIVSVADSLELGLTPWTRAKIVGDPVSISLPGKPLRRGNKMNLRHLREPESPGSRTVNGSDPVDPRARSLPQAHE